MKDEHYWNDMAEEILATLDPNDEGFDENDLIAVIAEGCRRGFTDGFLESK